MYAVGVHGCGLLGKPHYSACCSLVRAYLVYGVCRALKVWVAVYAGVRTLGCSSKHSACMRSLVCMHCMLLCWQGEVCLGLHVWMPWRYKLNLGCALSCFVGLGRWHVCTAKLFLRVKSVASGGCAVRHTKRLLWWVRSVASGGCTVRHTIGCCGGFFQVAELVMLLAESLLPCVAFCVYA